MIELREYQKKAIKDTRDAFRKNKKVILTAPCGSGKTVVALTIVKSALEKGKRVAFIVDRLSLLDQTANVMYNAGIDFGIIQGDNPLTDYSKQFQICSAQTLARRKSHDFDLIIIDESHICFKHQLDMLKNANGEFFLGLTATPFTRGLGKYWDDLVKGPSVGQLIKEGFLSQYRVFGPSKPDLRGVRTSAGDYNKKDLAKKTDTKKLVGDIIEHWFKLAYDRQTIVMAVNVVHAEHIANEFQAKGIKADFIHCYLKTGEAQKKLKLFRDGEIQVLASVDMISRGFDQPQASCLIMARPTKSLNYHLQALGRVLRPAPGKENALILDHAGNVGRLGFPDEEFEMRLRDGKEKIQREREKKKPLPRPCPKCFYMKQPKELVCPNCGHEAKRPLKVVVEDGDLQELQKYRHKKTPSEKKEKLYEKLLAGAQCAGFSPGWAAHKYKEYFGVWPAKKANMDEKFYNWLNTLPRWKMLRIVWGLVKDS